MSWAKKQHILIPKHLSAYPYSLSADRKFERLSLDHPLGSSWGWSGVSPGVNKCFLFDPQNDFQKLGNVILKKSKSLAYLEKSEDVAMLSLRSPKKSPPSRVVTDCPSTQHVSPTVCHSPQHAGTTDLANFTSLRYSSPGHRFNAPRPMLQGRGGGSLETRASPLVSSLSPSSTFGG